MDIAGKLEALNPIISNILSLSGSPGLSMGVLNHGAIIHTTHFGRQDVNFTLPPDDDTVYFIGSLIKLITASAVALLVHEGKVDWDRPIKKYLPEFQARSDDIGQKATIRDLLSARTGLAVSHASSGQQNGEMILPRHELLRTAVSLPAVAPLRKRFVYSQWSYGLVTEIVEKITGSSFGSFIRARFLNPLDIQCVTFASIQGDNSGKNISKAHAIRNDGTACTIIEPAWSDETGFAGAGGCNVLSVISYDCINPFYARMRTKEILSPHIRAGSSDIDQLAYCLGLYRSRLPANLSVASFNQQLLNAARVRPPSTGSQNAGLHVYHQTGATPGYCASMFLVPSTETAVVALTNSLPLLDCTDFVAQLLLKVVLGENPIQEEYLKLSKVAKPMQIVGYERLATAMEKRKSSTPPPLPISKYEGDYHNSLGNIIYVMKVLRNGLQMTIRGTSRTSYFLLPYGGDTFYWVPDRQVEPCDKAMWPFMSAENHKIIFGVSTTCVNSFTWWHDPLGQPEIFRKQIHGSRI